MAKTLHQYPHLARVHQEINEMFERLVETSGGVTMEAWDPPCDVFHKSDVVFVRMDLPGVDKKDMVVALRGNTLVIRGHKRAHRFPASSVLCFHCMETAHGRFEKIVRIETPVDVRNTTANLKDGVLTVRMPLVKDRRGSEFEVRIEEE